MRQAKSMHYSTDCAETKHLHYFKCLIETAKYFQRTGNNFEILAYTLYLKLQQIHTHPWSWLSLVTKLKLALSLKFWCPGSCASGVTACQVYLERQKYHWLTQYITAINHI